MDKSRFRYWLAERWEIFRPAICGDEICGKVLSETTLEERRAVSSIGGHEQGYMHAPTRQHSIGFFTVAIGEGEEVVVAENEYIEMR